MFGPVQTESGQVDTLGRRLISCSTELQRCRGRPSAKSPEVAPDDSPPGTAAVVRAESAIEPGIQ
jgi:hypothetical protein